MKSIDYYLKITYNLLIAKQKRNVRKCIKKEGFYMRKRNITGLLFAAALVMAGSQMGVLESQARPHHGDDWEDRWEDRWDDDRWDDDDDDDDDDHHWVEETIITEETAEMMTASTVQLSAVLSMSCTSARKIIPCGPTEKFGQQALQTEKAT